MTYLEFKERILKLIRGEIILEGIDCYKIEHLPYGDVTYKVDYYGEYFIVDRQGRFANQPDYTTLIAVSKAREINNDEYAWEGNLNDTP